MPKRLLGWAFCGCLLPPFALQAPTDPWSKGAHRRVSLPPLNFDASYALCFRGLSHMYLGQRGTTKLAAKGGVEVPANYKFWPRIQDPSRQSGVLGSLKAGA